MKGLKGKLAFFSLILLLALGVFAYPFASFASNSDGGVALFSETDSFDVDPVFQKGLSYSAWESEDFSTSKSDESLRRVTETGTEWVAICLQWVQSNTTSHDIRPDPIRSPTNESVRHAIMRAHSLGLKVMLKPMVDTLEEEKFQGYPTVWRGEIEPTEEWFESYSHFINFFAEFAEENGVELFCVGCEFKATTVAKENWEEVIAGVRERFSGPITYAADGTNYDNIEWWDSVDYVGIDAYFPLAVFLDHDVTFEDFMDSWAIHADDIEEWLSTVNKPVIFTEIGYRSGDGTSMFPSNYWSVMEVDLQEQRDCYEAAFQTLWNKSWFYGFYWWTWLVDPEGGGANDPYHTPQNKPAQDVITHWYSQLRQTAVVDQTFTSANRSGVGESQSVGFHVSWEHNSADVAGAEVYVNGTDYITNSSGWVSFSSEHDSVGKLAWVVTDFEHPEANLYKVAAESPYIIWDEVVVDVEVDSAMLGAMKVRAKVEYAYDGASVTGATTFVNGELCDETELGVYVAEIASWSPFEQVTVQATSEYFPEKTWTISAFHLMNTVLYLAVITVVILVLFLFLKRRQNSSKQPIEEIKEDTVFSV